MDWSKAFVVSKLMHTLGVLEEIVRNTSVGHENYVLSYIDNGRKYSDRSKRLLREEVNEEIKDILEKHNKEILKEINDKMSDIRKALESM